MGIFGNTLFANANNAANATANNTAVVETKPYFIQSNGAPEEKPQTVTPVRPANDEDTVCYRPDKDLIMSDFEYEQALAGNWTPWNEACRRINAEEAKEAAEKAKPAPTAPVVKEKYVAPQSATEAKQRIEAAIEAGRVKLVPSSEDGQLQFVGKTFALQQAFRMLGGTFDKGASIWSLPLTHWQNPEQCADLVKNELDKQAKRDESREAFEKRVEEAVAKRIEAEKAKWQKENTTTATGKYTMEQMQAYSLKCIKAVLSQMSGMSDDKLKGVISKVAC